MVGSFIGPETGSTTAGIASGIYVVDPLMLLSNKFDEILPEKENINSKQVSQSKGYNETKVNSSLLPEFYNIFKSDNSISKCKNHVSYTWDIIHLLKSVSKKTFESLENHQ